jgi:hypothetical protein
MTIVAMVFSASVMTGCGQTINNIDSSGLISLIYNGPVADMPTERKKPSTVPTDVDVRQRQGGRPPGRPRRVPAKTTAPTTVSQTKKMTTTKAKQKPSCLMLAQAVPCSKNTAKAWIPEPVRNPTRTFSGQSGGGYGGLR